MVAVDVFQFQLASLANLYAAISWSLANLLTKAEADRDKVVREYRAALAAAKSEQDAGGSDCCGQNDSSSNSSNNSTALVDHDVLDTKMPFIDSVCQESLRLSQQSITLRKVLRTCTFPTETGIYTLPEGTYIATLLSVTNVDRQATQHGPPLDAFAPERFSGAKLNPALYPKRAPRYGLSTFGHGSHVSHVRREGDSI